MAPSPPSGPEKLNQEHDASRFDCGHESLNHWLQRFARVNQSAHSAQTYVIHRNHVIIGYYSLAVGSVRKEEAPERVGKGLAQHPIGVIVLARLAVHKSGQGSGLGRALLKDALVRIAAAADIVGARAVLVHAIDAKARSFYERFDFERSPFQEFDLWLLMKDLKAALKQ